MSCRRVGFVVAGCFLALSCSSSDGEPTGGRPGGGGIQGDGGVANVAGVDPAVAPELPGGQCDADFGFQLRTDNHPSGNRVVAGQADLTTQPVVVTLDEVPNWVVPYQPELGSWLVMGQSGAAVVVGADGQVRPLDTPLTAGDPPVVTRADGTSDQDGNSAGDEPGVVSAHGAQDLFAQTLPDARVVYAATVVAALGSPTDRYAHDVLGDAVEAASVEIADLCTGERTRIDIPAPSVIEGISPMLIHNPDAPDDGDTPESSPQLLVTLSNDEVGAWLVLYDLDGTVIAQSEPIGTGYRWRNQLGAALLGPDGEFEIVDVRTPHLGGTVQYFRVNGDRLERVAAIDGYTSHVLGSPNLDLGVIVDADGDGSLDVVVPSFDRTRLGVLTRVADRGDDDDTAQGVGGVRVTHSVELGAALASNISAVDTGSGVAMAVGTAQAELLIWPAPG